MGCPLRSAGSQSQGSSVGRASGFKKTERRGFESRSCGKRKIKKNECVIVPNLDSMTAIKAKPFGCAVVLGDAAANAIKNAEKCVKSISADCYDVNPSEREWNLIKQLD